MICYKRSFQVFCLIMTVLASRGQQLPVNQLDSVAARIIRAVRLQNDEKAYIKPDKFFYSTGEKIWFRSFLCDQYTGRLSAKTNKLFVDLVNEKDSVVQKILLPSSQYKMDGNISLSDTLPTGFYWLRAYTKHMALFRPHDIGVQPIYVVNLSKPATRHISDINEIGDETKSRSKNLLMDFYPEGGTVISGVNTVIAFRVKDEDGMPHKATGLVKDDRDSVVASFQTNSFGLGKITFFPSIWRKYEAHLKSENGKETVFSLPKVDLFAAQLSVIDYRGVKKLRVILEDSIYKNDKRTYILGLSGDSLCLAAIGMGNYEVTVPESQFPYGIANFLLFDEQNHLLSERKLFISGNKLKVDLISDKTSYTARQNVRLDISIRNAESKPMVASLLVEVIDSSLADKIQAVISGSKQYSESLANISQWTLLDRSFTDEDLDLFMLTQKKSLKGIIGALKADEGKHSINNELDTSFYIKGTITDKLGRPLENKIVTLFSAVKNMFSFADTTDSNGSFCFPLIFYYDQTKFNIQVTDKRAIPLDAKIKLDTLLRFPHFTTPSYLKQRFSIDGVNEFFTDQRNVSLQDTVIMGKDWLKEVIVKSTIKKPVDYNRDKRLSSFSKIISGKALQDGGSNNIGNALFKIPGVTIRNGYLVIRGGNGFHAPSAADEPLLVVDGLAITPDGFDPMNPGSPVLGFLSTFSFRLVDFIEVLTGPEAAFFGSRGFNGVILIHTKTTQTEIGDAQSNGQMSFTMPGYQVPVELSQPDYSIKENRNSKFPDRRTLLYWNGDVITDEKGNASINFYTSDSSTRYFVIVTGVTADGGVINKQVTINRK